MQLKNKGFLHVNYKNLQMFCFTLILTAKGTRTAEIRLCLFRRKKPRCGDYSFLVN